MVDDEFAMVLTDATSVSEHMQKIVQDLKQRFPQTKIYIMSISCSTLGSPNVSQTNKDALTNYFKTLNPFEIKLRIKAKLDAIFKHTKVTFNLTQRI